MTHPAFNLALPTGVKLGSFVIREVVGANRHAYTYVAYDRSLAREVIIKECFPIGLAARSPGTNEVIPKSEEVAARLEQQKEHFLELGQVMAGLECPGVVPIYGVYEALGTAYAVVAKVKGTTLEKEMEKRYIHHKKWEMCEVKNLLEALLSSLDYLHNKEVFHRDIRPSHILLAKSSFPIWIGFDFTPPEKDHGKSGLAVSTECSSPEKILGHECDERACDIYSLGATFHKLITGSYPKRGDIRLYSERSRRLSENAELLEIYPKPFLTSLDKALEPQKEYRFKSAGEWLYFIENACPDDDKDKKSSEDRHSQTVVIETELILNEEEEMENDEGGNEKKPSSRSRRRRGVKSLLKNMFMKNNEEK